MGGALKMIFALTHHSCSSACWCLCPLWVAPTFDGGGGADLLRCSLSTCSSSLSQPFNLPNGNFSLCFSEASLLFYILSFKTLASHASPFFLIYTYKHLIYARQSLLSALKVRNVVKRQSWALRIYIVRRGSSRPMCCYNKSMKVCAKREAQSRRKVQGEILVAKAKKRLHGRGAGWERTRRVAGISRGTGVWGYIPGRKNSEDKTRHQETRSGFREQLAEPLD